MKADLHGIIRLRKWEVDEKRRVLGQLLDREAQIVGALERLQREVEEEGRMASAHVREGGMAFGAYAQRSLQRRDMLLRALEEARKQVEQARDAMAEAFKDLKTLELTQEARDTAAREEQDHKEQLVLDEIGLTLYRRSQPRP